MKALAYTCIIGFVSQDSSPIPGVTATIVLSGCAWLLIRLDLFLSATTLGLAAGLIFAPPFLAGLSLILQLRRNALQSMGFFLGGCLQPLTFGLHTTWLVFMLELAKAQTKNGIALPTNFRSVLYLDVFGWLYLSDQRSPTQQETHQLHTSGTAQSDPAELPPRMLSRVEEEDTPHAAHASAEVRDAFDGKTNVYEHLTLRSVRYFDAEF